MARFRGTVSGARGQASRLGHGSITTNANGWDVGVRVTGYADKDGTGAERDAFEISATGGSHGSALPRFIGTITRKGDRLVFKRAPSESRRIGDALRAAKAGR